MMRRSLPALALLFLLAAAAISLPAQDTKPAGETADHSAAPATRGEVDELRGQIAAQQQTIEELKAQLQRITLASGQKDARLLLTGATVVSPEPASPPPPLQQAASPGQPRCRRRV